MGKKRKALRSTLKSQYHSALAMLKQAIELWPDELWESEEHPNAPWRVAYHAVFFAHFYLHRDEEAFRPWEGHQYPNQNPDGLLGPPDPESDLPHGPEPYTKVQVLEYWRICDAMVDGAIDEMDLDREECGFDWYPIPKLEHQLVNLRHIQHHAGQLADRLRASRDVGVRWVGARRPD